MTTPIDDSLLNAWLDDELDPDDRARVEAWLREHPEEAARVRLWAADGEAMRAALAVWAPDVAVLDFPAWDCLPYDRVSPNPEISSRRMATLALLAAISSW